MRKRMAMALTTGALVLGSMGLASGRPCPASSHNPGGDPPNCGQSPAEQVEDVCPDGIVTGPADELTGGNLNEPLCQIHEGVEDLTGVPV